MTNQTKNTMITTEIRLSKNPALTMSRMWTKPVPKTTALGGVATGNIKAHEAESVAPTISTCGCKPITSDNEINIGSIILTVATLDVTSVRKFTEPTMIGIKVNASIDSRPIKSAPT